MKIPLARPDIGKEEISAVKKVLETPFLANGPKGLEFEKAFASFIKVKYAAAVSSGTAGLHLALRACNVGQGDEVITTPLSFIASANAILYVGATPVFVDVDPVSWNIDPLRIEKAISPRTKAILPVHLFGQPCEMEAITSMARKHNLSVVEDACEALGAMYEDKFIGTQGDLAVFAFYPNKQITTGEGGMVVSNNKETIALVQSMRNQGRSIDRPKLLEHVNLGYNYRMDEMSAALGLAQMKKLKKILKTREDLANIYKELVDNVENVEVLPDLPGSTRSWFVFVVKLSSDVKRDEVMVKLQKKGIECAPYFPCIHLQPYYKHKFGYKEGTFPTAENVAKSTLALPFHNRITRKEMQFVTDALIDILER